MGIPPLPVIALFVGFVLIVLGFVATLQKSDKTEDESMKRSHERMKKLFEATPTKKRVKLSAMGRGTRFPSTT
jgi:uncharacterized membrane protein